MNPKQEKALAALLTSSTQAEAARKSGVDESTLRRYLKEPSFRALYRSAVCDIVEDAAQQARSAMSAAIQTLEDVCADDTQNAQVRVGAARSILEYALRLHELGNIEERLAALERMK